MRYDSPFSLGPSMFRGLHWTASCVGNFIVFFSSFSFVSGFQRINIKASSAGQQVAVLDPSHILLYANI